jgi:asparagine synthase (glutamine-hydrolysing)
MCGIGGIIGRETSNVEINILMESLRHRGPDGFGFESGKWGFTLHTRLSILDLSNNANQPFVKFDNSVITTHNGEIYNYNELLQELSQTPDLASQSDSEIIPFLYNEFGVKAMSERLEGMFAISILDLQINKFFLVRDKFGIKPLYYFYDGNSLIFGSEIKALLPFLSDEQKQIDAQMAFDFMSLGYIVEPNTFYKNIKAVPPGQILQFDLKEKSIEFLEYSSQKNHDNNQFGFQLKEFDELLGKIIKEQCRSDVPMGSFLSGGVDSTLITSYYSKVSASPGTFNITFGTKDRDESEIAAKTAQLLGCNHEKIRSDNGVSPKLVDSLIKHFDQPFGDLAFISSYVLTAAVSKQIKVVLSGDGGDEFVAGYPKFKQVWLINKIPKVILPIMKLAIWDVVFSEHKLKRLRNLIGKSEREQICQLSSYLDESVVGSFFLGSFQSPCRHFNYDKKYSLIQNITLNQKNTSLVSKMLPKVDRMSMLNSIEVRVPLLDTRLTRKLFNLKDKYKLSLFDSKIAYKKLLKISFPGYRSRRKVGFDYNYKELENMGLVSYWIESILSTNKESNIWVLLSRDKVENWINRFLSNSNTGFSKQTQVQVIFNVYVLLKWYEWH